MNLAAEAAEPPPPPPRTRLGRNKSPARTLIESLPLKMPTDEVIKRCEQAGVKASRSHVHNIRWMMRVANKKTGKKTGNVFRIKASSPSTTAKKALAPAPAVARPTERELKMQLFKRLILELGMDDAQTAWDEFAYVRDGIGGKR